MAGIKCPFSVIQASGSCTCAMAQEVIRRGGSEYDCTDEHKHALCDALVSRLNAVALPALGYEDDLNLTPKSVYERILLGGLLALDGRGADDASIDNIERVVSEAATKFGSWASLEQAMVVPTIKASRVRKRRRR